MPPQMSYSQMSNRNPRQQPPPRYGNRPGLHYPTVPQIDPGGYLAPPVTDPYPGGLIGEQGDYNLRNTAGQDEMQAYLQSLLSDQNAYNSSYYGNQTARNNAMLSNYLGGQQSNNSIRQTAAGLATGGQIQNAEHALQPGMDFYSDYMNGGQRYQSDLASQQQNITGNANAQADTLNSGLAARGLGGNAYAGLATRQQGQFAAAGARGALGAQLHMQGGQGYSDLSKQYADFAARPTQEGALSQLQNYSMPTANQMAITQSNYQPDTSGAYSIYSKYAAPPANYTNYVNSQNNKPPQFNLSPMMPKFNNPSGGF